MPKRARSSQPDSSAASSAAAGSSQKVLADASPSSKLGDAAAASAKPRSRARGRARKRARIEESPQDGKHTDGNGTGRTLGDGGKDVPMSAAPREPAEVSKPVTVASASAAAVTTAAAKAANKQQKTKKQREPAPREPKKRPLLAGTLKRLAVPKPISTIVRKSGSGSTRADVNRRGNRINKGWGTGGFEAGVPVLPGEEDVGTPVTAADKGKGRADPADAEALVDADGQQARLEEQARKKIAGEELWIKRAASYPAYLKEGLAAFRSRGHHTLTLHALGAAIPTCLSLAMAIRDALPCGPEGSELEVRTGSIDVNDEIVPPDDSDGEELDIQYQVRTKSTVECVLRLKKGVRERILVKSRGVSGSVMGVRPGRGGRGGGGGRGRGSSMRGGGRGRSFVRGGAH